MTRTAGMGARSARLLLFAALTLSASSTRLQGQAVPIAMMLNGPDDRSGPRFGVVWLTAGSATADSMNRRVAPIMTLLGWQFEHQFDQPEPEKPVPVIETILLLGGLEQNVALPSMTTILGLRQPNGWEGGFGALLTPAGPSLIVAAGVTQVVGNFNVPLNLAIAPGRRGLSISFTSGINERRFRRR